MTINLRTLGIHTINVSEARFYAIETMPPQLPPRSNPNICLGLKLKLRGFMRAPDPAYLPRYLPTYLPVQVALETRGHLGMNDQTFRRHQLRYGTA